MAKRPVHTNCSASNRLREIGRRSKIYKYNRRFTNLFNTVLDTVLTIQSPMLITNETNSAFIKCDIRSVSQPL